LSLDISSIGGEVRSDKEDIGVTNGGVSASGSSTTTPLLGMNCGLEGVWLPEPLGVFICDFEIDSDPGAEGVTYREKEETARKRPRATFVMENKGRS